MCQNLVVLVENKKLIKANLNSSLVFSEKGRKSFPANKFCMVFARTENSKYLPVPNRWPSLLFAGGVGRPLKKSKDLIYFQTGHQKSSIVVNHP